MADLATFETEIRKAQKAHDGAAALALLEQMEREAERLADLAVTQPRSPSALWLFEGDRTARDAGRWLVLSIRAAQIARHYGQHTPTTDPDRRFAWCEALRVKLGIEP